MDQDVGLPRGQPSQQGQEAGLLRPGVLPTRKKILPALSAEAEMRVSMFFSVPTKSQKLPKWAILPGFGGPQKFTALRSSHWRKIFH